MQAYSKNISRKMCKINLQLSSAKGDFALLISLEKVSCFLPKTSYGMFIGGVLTEELSDVSCSLSSIIN